MDLEGKREVMQLHVSEECSEFSSEWGEFEVFEGCLEDVHTV